MPNTTIDHDRVANLLAIVRECSGHTGKLASISNAAMKELLELNDQLKEEAMKANADEAKRRQQIEARRQQLAAQSQGTIVEGADRPVPIYPSDSETASIADRRI